ncbi:uncharacterized protein LOC135170935 [Diachasmimorpha longicaudata]|uniref:uncharacterized protein LOC135170935 n=1 Tax=Diachasmimorpha longicaudata TaxID=58733 RepID=UPI0030B91793
MTRIIYTFLLLILGQYTCRANVLRQLNDEVRKINELVYNLSSICDSPSLRGWRRALSSDRSETALTGADKLQQKSRSLWTQFLDGLNGDLMEDEGKQLVGDIAPRSLNSSTDETTRSGRKDFAFELKLAEKIRDEAQDRVNKLREAKEIEDKIKAQIAMEMSLKEEKEREEKLKAEKLREEQARQEQLREEKAKEKRLQEELEKQKKLNETRAQADAATMEPPKFVGPTLSSQQLFNNFFYEALGNTMRQIISNNSELKENLGEDWDPATLMGHNEAPRKTV